MKITFVLPHANLAGGIRVVAIYAESLQQRGHQVFVISQPPRAKPLHKKIKYFFKYFCWPKKHPQKSHFSKKFQNHRIIERCRPITNTDVPDADVIIATWWETAEWVNQLHPSKGKKVYFVQHHEIFEHLPVARAKATYHMPFLHIAVSQWLVDILRNEYDAQNVQLVPNSVDYNFFNAPQRKRQSRPTIGFMYSPVPYKGCDLVLAALQRVIDKIPNLRILSFGSRHPSSKLQLPPNTEFTCQPSQNKIVDIYSSCDFWLFCSRVEGYGLPILEAMACHTPVIGTMAGAAPELIGKGGGLLINGWKIEDISDTILKGFSLTESDWQDLSLMARKTASHYSWNDAVDLFEKALQL